MPQAAEGRSSRRYGPAKAPPAWGEGETDADGEGELGLVGASAPPHPPRWAISTSAAARREGPLGGLAKGHFMRRWTSKRACYSSVRARVNPRRRSRLELHDPGRSAFAKYQDLVVGSRDPLRLVLHELVVIATSWVPGALGLLLRKLAYPLLLGAVGRNVTFGHG